MDHDPIVPHMSQNPSNDEAAVLLLIQEMMKESYVPNEELVDALIANKQVPEEYAQRLLRFKLTYAFNHQEYSLILNEFRRLNDLENPLNRLVCNTIEYYKLVSLFAQALIAIEKYEAAYEYIHDIREEHFSQSYFYELPDKERKLIIAELLAKQAVAAHLSTGDYNKEAYPLFKSISILSEMPFEPNLSNLNIFIMFGYECREREQYEEASTIFQKLYLLMQSKENINRNELELFREITAMYIITSILALKAVDATVMKQYKSLFATSEGSPLVSKINVTLKAQVERFICKKEKEDEVALFNPFFGPMWEEAASHEKKALKAEEAIKKKSSRPLNG